MYLFAGQLIEGDRTPLPQPPGVLIILKIEVKMSNNKASRAFKFAAWHVFNIYGSIQ